MTAHASRRTQINVAGMACPTLPAFVLLVKTLGASCKNFYILYFILFWHHSLHIGIGQQAYFQQSDSLTDRQFRFMTLLPWEDVAHAIGGIDGSQCDYTHTLQLGATYGAEGDHMHSLRLGAQMVTRETACVYCFDVEAMSARQ